MELWAGALSIHTAAPSVGNSLLINTHSNSPLWTVKYSRKTLFTNWTPSPSRRQKRA